jgi:trehalose-phosphatase
MSVVTEAPAFFKAFFKSIHDGSRLALVADFDGTLAPFCVDRDAVIPYPGVPEALLRLIVNGAHVSIVTGRPGLEAKRKLGISSLEVWGCHGAERLLPNGERLAAELPETTNNIQMIVEALAQEQICSEVEVKPLGVAIHWRGLSLKEINELRFAACRVFRTVSLPGFDLFDFDGGMEFRSRDITKANAVRQIRQERPMCSIVYLGDDLTDEDAFRALGPTDLSVLVRPEFRPTAAQVWLRPPKQLIALLDNLTFLTGGSA